MMPLTDETLMAYADGALSADEQRAVGTALATDPEARRTVSMFAMTRDLVRHAFSEPMWRLRPHALVEAILGSCGRAGSPSACQRNSARVIRPLLAFAIGVLTVALLGVVMVLSAAKSHGPEEHSSWSGSDIVARDRHLQEMDKPALGLRLEISPR